MKKIAKIKTDNSVPMCKQSLNNLHGHVKEDGQEKLVIDGHGDESALVKFGRSLPHHDTQADTPEQKQKFNWKEKKNGFNIGLTV